MSWHWSRLDWLAGRKTPVINMSFAGDSNAVVALASSA